MIELDPCASRALKPRKLTEPSTRPIIALDPGHAGDDGYAFMENGSRVSFSEYARNIVHLDPHIVVCFSPETWLLRLHDLWHEYPRWSWRVAVTDKHGNALRVKRVAYYGFRDPKKRRNRYHVVLDAGSFFRKQDVTADDLLALGQDVRAFCNANGLEIRSSAAGIAVQLLRHPMFYPFARRHAPSFINAAAQKHLPGGHYDTYADPEQRMTAALYVDQESAYHYAAQTTPLPNANSVRAIGYTRSNKPYARKGGTLYEREMQKHGLLKLAVRVNKISPAKLRFAPPLLQVPGHKRAFVWTNELPYLESLGMEVDYLIAAWGTQEVDEGIAKYAQWAQQVQRQYPWLKALLLMPYGLLGRRPSKVTYHHPGGKDTMILANMMLDDVTTSTVETYPETANTLQLGLIQAFVRALSLDMARQATANGHEVVSIYADGVFIRVAKDGSIPLFAPWRVKEECYLEVTESMRVPVRRALTRRYQGTQVTTITEG